MFVLDTPTLIAVVTLVTESITGLVTIVSLLIGRSKLQELHISLNGRLTELLRTTKIASHAEGRAEGKAEGKAENRTEIKIDTSDPITAAAIVTAAATKLKVG